MRRPQFLSTLSDTRACSRSSQSVAPTGSVFWAALALVAAAGSARLVLAAETPENAADWTLTADGSHYLQRSTHLLWPRCVEGMRWHGKDCAGQPLWLDHMAAQALVRQRSKIDGRHWCLPHLKELQQLPRLNSAPTTKAAAPIPASTEGWVWTGTIPIEVRSVNPYSYSNVMNGVNGQNVSQMKFLHAWVVNTATGESREDVLKRTPMFVRLVRKSDEPLNGVNEAGGTMGGCSTTPRGLP